MEMSLIAKVRWLMGDVIDSNRQMVDGDVIESNSQMVDGDVQMYEQSLTSHMSLQ